jgi:hypothetical protein
MKTLADRFRRWCEYERDCNAKSLAMPASVPPERRGASEFQKSVDRMAYLVAARRRWLNRLGAWPEAPDLFPQGISSRSCPIWSRPQNGLDAVSPAPRRNRAGAGIRMGNCQYRPLPLECGGRTDPGVRPRVVSPRSDRAVGCGSGGKAVDTDYIFWTKLVPVEPKAG